MLYFFHGREAVVVSHGIVKQKDAVPSVEIELAIRRMRAFKKIRRLTRTRSEALEVQEENDN
jgi:phage-related protein